MEKWRQEFIRRNSAIEISSDEQKIIERFKTYHPELMKLNPEIAFSKFIKIENGKEIEGSRIEVNHSFVFDLRLIPKVFENIEVVGISFDPMPKEFPSGGTDLLFENYFEPENYERFVINNIDLIRKKLHRPDLSDKEALDALTGDFNKHKEYIKKMRKEREIEHKEHIDFFNELLIETGEAYKKSDIYKNLREKEWNYSVSATCLTKNRPLILGFNWGAEKEKPYVPQSEYVYENFGGLYDELGSLKKILSMAEKYDLFHEFQSANQSNYCFFRSKYESQISPADLELCRPLFEELIDYLNPTKIYNFSRKLHRYWESKGILQIKTLEIPNGKSTVYSSKGKVKIDNKILDYFNLPHPNSQVYEDSRKKTWEFCFRN